MNIELNLKALIRVVVVYFQSTMAVSHDVVKSNEALITRQDHVDMLPVTRQKLVDLPEEHKVNETNWLR